MATRKSTHVVRSKRPARTINTTTKTVTPSDPQPAASSCRYIVRVVITDLCVKDLNGLAPEFTRDYTEAAVFSLEEASIAAAKLNSFRPEHDPQKWQAFPVPEPPAIKTYLRLELPATSPLRLPFVRDARSKGKPGTGRSFWSFDPVEGYEEQCIQGHCFAAAYIENLTEERGGDFKHLTWIVKDMKLDQNSGVIVGFMSHIDDMLQRHARRSRPEKIVQDAEDKARRMRAYITNAIAMEHEAKGRRARKAA